MCANACRLTVLLQRRTNPHIQCPFTFWKCSWELPKLHPLLHESPPLFYPSDHFVANGSDTFRLQAAVAMVGSTTPHILHHMARAIQDSICQGLAKVSREYDPELLRAEAYRALEWLRTQEVYAWYEEPSQNKRRFMALLEWIAQETERIGNADGYFITLNYVVSQSFSGSRDAPLSSFDHTILLQKHWTPLMVDGFMVRGLSLLLWRRKQHYLETDAANRIKASTSKRPTTITECKLSPGVQPPEIPSKWTLLQLLRRNCLVRAALLSPFILRLLLQHISLVCVQPCGTAGL